MVIAEQIAKYWPKALSISSIRGRLALFLALALLPAGAIAIQTGVNTAASRSAAVAERSAGDARSAGERVARAAQEMSDVLRVLSTARNLRALTPAGCRNALASITEQYSGIGTIAVMSTEGVVRCSVPTPTTQVRVQSRAFLTAKERGDIAFSYVAHGRLAGVPVIAANAPMRDEAGNIVGFIGLSSPFARFVEVAGASDVPRSTTSVLVDGSGERVAPPLREGEAALPSPELVRRALAANQLLFRGSAEDVLITPLHAPDLYLVAAWRPPTRSFSDMLAFGFAVASPLLMWIIAITVGWLAIEAFVSRPLSQVDELARSYVRGAEAKLNEDVENAPEEIRSLARTLTAMARTLRVREQRLAEALREERALLREVHHRVKNNLQVVASLLNIQARAAHDTSEAWGLARAHDRVQLLSIVHQRIYSSGEVREVRLDEIARDIARHLTQSRGDAIAEIELEMHIDAVRCDVDHAVPMGFLIAESISNALDHAPPNGREKFVLRMTQDDGGPIRFSINAPLDPRIAVEPEAKVRLVEAFARQLGAQVARQAANGRYRVWAETPPLVAAAA